MDSLQLAHLSRGWALVVLLTSGCSTPSKDKERPTDTSPVDDVPCPEEQWIDVSAGGGITCGLCTTGRVSCWGERPPEGDTGYGNYGDLDAPDGEFVDVEVAKDIAPRSGAACALDADGNPTCWGRNDHGQAAPPDDTFAALSIGVSTTCGLSHAGSVSCWGQDVVEGHPVAVAGAGYRQLVSTGNMTCALSPMGDSTCWLPVSSSPEQFWTHPGPWTAIATMDAYSCGVAEAGQVTCWEYYHDEEYPLMEEYGAAEIGPVRDLCLGSFGGCALLDGGVATCFGPYTSTPSPPDKSFVKLSCGTYHACGLTTDGTLECWGTDCGAECDVP